ncbi:MAG: acyl carrier protein [Proteobacteria bacterium]|nr:acyl carrier protein [Pseudomonadota bacterium]
MLDANLVRRRIAEILTSKDVMSLQLDVSQLADAMSLSDDMALDSIQKMEFCIALEEEFGVALDVRLFESSLDTFGALVAYVAKNATKHGAG